MISWNRTLDGWAVNLDGTNAAREFTLPRIELHSGAGGWTCLFRLEDGMARPVRVATSGGATAAKRAGVEEALRTLGGAYEARLRELL